MLYSHTVPNTYTADVCRSLLYMHFFPSTAVLLVTLWKHGGIKTSSPSTSCENRFFFLLMPNKIIVSVSISVSEWRKHHLSIESKTKFQQNGNGWGRKIFVCLLITKLVLNSSFEIFYIVIRIYISVVNAKLSQHRFWPCHANGLNKIIPMILHNLNSRSLVKGTRKAYTCRLWGVLWEKPWLGHKNVLCPVCTILPAHSVQNRHIC